VELDQFAALATDLLMTMVVGTD